jgi:hypothetical protein
MFELLREDRDDARPEAGGHLIRECPSHEACNFLSSGRISPSSRSRVMAPMRL